MGPLGEVDPQRDAQALAWAVDTLLWHIDETAAQNAALRRKVAELEQEVRAMRKAGA